MGSVSNGWFCSSSVLNKFIAPIENKRVCNFVVSISKNALKSSKIYCKLPETESSGIQQNPTKGRPSSSGTKMEEYNVAMKRMMRNPYEYHHDLGMNYTLITDNLIVGSQPQKPEDIDHLKKEENVAYILNLQQDKDVEFWGIDLQLIIKRCRELGIRHMRRPARDFDPDSLRSGLPKAVAIAYMFWFCGMNLNTAYDTLTSKRPCGPNRRAIRGATYDLAKNDPWKEPFESLPEHAFEGMADWERNLIQGRVRSLRGS